MDYNLFQIWHDLAVEIYNVNPAIFIFLMLASIPPYYYGWYGLLREAIDFRKRYKDKHNDLKVTDILRERNFLLPLAINRGAWVLPYIYVIFWGKNIPLWFWIMFFGWIGLSTYLFWNKLKRELVANINYSGKFVWLIYSYFYDLLMYFRPYKDLLSLVVESLDIKEEDRLINYGCGSGNLEKYFSKSGFHSIVSLDFSASMLNIAKRKCPNCKYFQIDLQKERYNQGIKFDKAASVNLVYNLEDLDYFFKGVRGNLKMGGTFIISTSINDGFGTLIKDHFRDISFKDLLLTMMFIVPFMFVLLVNVYLDRKYRKNFYKESMLINRLENNGFKVLKSVVCYGGINVLIIAEAV